MNTHYPQKHPRGSSPPDPVDERDRYGERPAVDPARPNREQAPADPPPAGGEQPGKAAGRR